MKEVVLVIVAHPDDELLGEGGTIRRLVNIGVEAHAIILAEGITSRFNCREESDKDDLVKLQKDAREAAKEIGYSTIEFCGFPDNRMDSIDLLDIVKTVTKYVDRYKPNIIFTHHHGDLNIDHRITCEAVLTSCRPVGNNCVKKIYAFETPSSTEWNYTYTEPFIPNVYFDITDSLQSKIDGMMKYRSESATSPHPRSSEALKALAEYRGSNVGVKYAEAFILLREII